MNKIKRFSFMIFFIIFTFFNVTNIFAIDKYAKVILVGDYRCGKTSMWKRVTNQSFDENELASDIMTYESFTERIDNQDVQFNVWDTAGADRYYNEVVDFTQGANFVIIVHDITASYDAKIEDYLSKLYADIHDKVDSNCKIMIAGSKYDLRHKNIVNASKQVGMLESVAKTIPCACVLTSSKEDNNIGINSIKEFLKTKSQTMTLYSQNPDSAKQKRFSIKKKSGWCTIL